MSATVLAPRVRKAIREASVGTPITRGGVSLFPVYLHDRATVDYLPGISALNSGVARFEEQPSPTVSLLRLVTETDLPVFFPEGDTLVGGLQNRVLNVSVLAAPHKETELPVSCVEQGRWNSHRGFQHGGSFAPRSVRHQKNVSVSHSLAYSESRRSDQAAVWARVEDELSRAGVRSSTQALHEASSQLQQGNSADMSDLAAKGPLPGQNGVVVAVGGQVIGLELFDRTETLAVYWLAIVTAYLSDMGRERQGRPSATRALRFLRKIAEGPVLERPGIGLGLEYHIQSNTMAGQALVVDDSLIHLSAAAA